MVETDAADEPLRVRAPLYLLTNTTQCWKCEQQQSVIALSALSLETGGEAVPDPADKEPELLILSYIEEMPPEVEAFLVERHARFRKHLSNTAGFTYFANVCECGANFGDHFLGEVDGPFFPADEHAAGQIMVSQLPFVKDMEFRSSFSQGAGSLIWKYGRRDF